MAQESSAERPACGRDATAVSAPGIWRQLIAPGDLVFDIGANIGNKAAELLECGARVVCVEPQPHCVEKLRGRFSGRPNVFIVPNGVAGKPDTLQLSICREKDYISTFAKNWKTGRFVGEHWDETVDVEVTTLDALIKTHGQPRFCKIDVEGFELEALNGLSQRVAFLSFEYSAEFQATARACLVRLNQLGYRYFNFSFGESQQFSHEHWLSSRELLDYLACQADPLFWGDIYARSEYQATTPVQIPGGELWQAGEKPAVGESILQRLAALPVARKVKSIGRAGSDSPAEREAFKQLFPNSEKIISIDANAENKLPAVDLLVLDNALESYRLLQRLTPELRQEIKLIYVEAALAGAAGGVPGLEEIRTLIEPDFVFLGFAPDGVENSTRGRAVFINLNQRPRVSAIVSTYNSEKFLRACLDDLEAQTIAQDIEIIVVDSGSQQNERAIVEEYQKRYTNIIYLRTERESLYAAWNRAVKLAKGRFITNANSDDSHRADALELLADALEAHPQADLSYGDYYTCSVPNDTFENPHIIRRVVHPPYQPATLLFYCVTGCHPMWRREVFSKLGDFDTQYTAPGDYEFLLRFARAGLRAVRVPEFLSLFYQNAQGLSFQSAARSRHEGELIYAKYRNETPIERLFAVNTETATLGWVALGNMAMNFKVPWISNYSRELDFAITCYERALANSARQPAALNNLAVARLLNGQPERAESVMNLMTPAQLHQFERDLKSGHWKIIEVEVKPAVAALEYRPPGAPVAVSLAQEEAKPLPLTVAAPGCPVRWITDFFVPGEYAADSLDTVLGLAPGIPAFGTLDHCEVFSEAYHHELPATAKAALQPSNANYHFLSGGITISSRTAKSFFMAEDALYNIGRTTVEADALPLSWVTVCNQMREIWVPSAATREIFLRSGVEGHKLRVIPTSVDSTAFSPEATAPADLPGRAAWNFLFTDDWSERSGWEELLNAYFREFSASDDVCLYIGSRLPGKTRSESADKIRQKISETATAIGSTARFEVLSFADSDLPRVLKACDCVVLPARSEGWGRNQLQALLMEKVLITTGWGAHTDFCNGDRSYLIDFKMVEIHTAEPELLPLRGMNWAAPSPEHLRALLREVQRHPEAARAKAHGHRAALAAGFDRAQVCNRIATRLGEISSQLQAAECPPAAPRITELEPANKAGSTRDVQVAWEGSFLDYGSLSHVNRELTAALSGDKHIHLARVSQPNPSVPEEFKDLARRIKSEAQGQPEVTVRHGWPPNWKRPAKGAWVLIQPWEFGVLPVNWMKQLCKVDEIWAPTEYVRRVYVDSGVHPDKVKIVPNGIDPKKFQPDLPAWPLATKKKFKFLFVGGTIYRKGPDVLLKAYLETFTVADDVCLIIKEIGGQAVYAGQTLAKEIAAAKLNPNAPEILHLTDELPVDAMPRVYAACDCLVHPYRGEGFGLPVLEAMACGLPAVVTGGGATDDFASDEYAYRLPAVRTLISDNIDGVKLCRKGWRLEPEQKALAERLRWVAAHPDEARTLGRAASDYVRREWTWERAGRIAGQRLQNLVARKGAELAAMTGRRGRKSGPLALPEAALLGQLREARELIAKKDFQAAWKSVLGALAVRPFHFEGYLLLAEIAKDAGDTEQARRCAERARQCAPDWKPAKQFLKGLAATGRKTEWPALPDEPKAPRLTVCLITRNEEQFLGKCLASICDVAHQIIVVDTGSTDATIEIAEEFNAEIYHFPWCDDFSAARNEALKHATGDWILSLDADEEFLSEHRQTLAAEMQTSGVIAYRLPIIDEGREQEGCSYVPRLFRNAPGLFFVGRIHEQVFASIMVRAGEWGLKNELGKSTLLHHGYTKEIVASRDKVARNLRLLELAMEELPNEPNLLMNYGLELVRSGETQAGLEQFFEALHALSRLPAAQVVPELRETLLTQLGTHLMAAKAFEEVVKLWQTPLAKSGGMTASQHFVLGLAQIELGHPVEAAGQMRECLAKRRQPTLSPINKEILKAGPNHCLALSLAMLEENAAAGQAFCAALADDPKSVAVRSDFARFQYQQNQPVEALKLLHELVTEKNDSLAIWQLGGQVALSQVAFLDFAQNWTAEAMKHFPKHPAILLQRAETLLLGQQVEAALPFWVEAQEPGSARHLAALTICEFLTGHCRRRFASADERLVSQEFLKWYRRLIAFGAHSLVRQLNERLAELGDILPGAVGVLTAALKQAEAAAPALAVK